MAKLGVDVKDAEKEQAVLDVVKQVKTAYFNILLPAVSTADDNIYRGTGCRDIFDTGGDKLLRSSLRIHDIAC